MRVLFALLLIVSLACAGAPTREKLSKKYTTVNGMLVAEPELESGRHRLVIYLKESPESSTLVCIAYNKDNKEVLVELATKLILGMGYEVILFGEKTESGLFEYVEGVDLKVIAIGFYSPKANKYQIVMTDYVPGLRDSIDWGNFMKIIAKSALKAAL